MKSGFLKMDDLKKKKTQTVFQNDNKKSHFNQTPLTTSSLALWMGGIFSPLVHRQELPAVPPLYLQPNQTLYSFYF